MPSNDTIDLLKECNSGVKMGVATIDDVIGKVANENFRKQLQNCMDEHRRLGDETHDLLDSYEYDGKEPSSVARGMSWVKTNVMLAMKDSDETVADLITDGCNMGVKSLNRYLNKYKNANQESKDLAKKLIGCEEQLASDIRKYL
ncbi:MAG: hypothetical protein MJ210_05960 [Alphaproteobacteria bacterium]|nr:hypothetical protein [Alphaproteobacteria bacterium]